MIRKRPEADNTQRIGPPKNVYWEMTKSGETCRYCGRIHDSAGRPLDERGKLLEQPARQDGDVKPVKPCPLAQKQQAQIKNAPKKVNRMLGTENEHLNRLPRK
jgi:hypothetical protein